MPRLEITKLNWMAGVLRWPEEKRGSGQTQIRNAQKKQKQIVGHPVLICTCVPYTVCSAVLCSYQLPYPTHLLSARMHCGHCAPLYAMQMNPRAGLFWFDPHLDTHLVIYNKFLHTYSHRRSMHCIGQSSVCSAQCSCKSIKVKSSIEFGELRKQL